MSDPTIAARILASGLSLTPSDHALLAVAIADVDRQSARLRGHTLSVGDEPSVVFAAAPLTA
jgi:hypothetical protein